MIKVFGQHSCIGCVTLEAELKKKKINYEFYNVTEPEGLAELAACGLADERTVPILLDKKGNKVKDLNTFVASL